MTEPLADELSLRPDLGQETGSKRQINHTPPQRNETNIATGDLSSLLFMAAIMYQLVQSMSRQVVDFDRLLSSCYQRSREIGRSNGVKFHGVPLVAWARTKALADAASREPIDAKNSFHLFKNLLRYFLNN